MSKTINYPPDKDPRNVASAYRVVNAVEAWWTNLRPVKWDVNQHLANSSVNCGSTAEAELAQTFANYLRDLIANNKTRPCGSGCDEGI